MRDYHLHPLKKNNNGHFIETIPYDEIYNQYIVLNKTISECCKYFNITETAFNRFLRKYNIRKPINLHQQNIKRLTKEKYGSENYRNTNKARETCFNKYGVDNISKTKYFKDFIHNNKDEIMDKIYKTKRENKSFNISKIEERIYRLLVTLYPNVKRQYTDERYPFACDFYIPEEDLFIEYQGNWTHGREPYIGTKEQQEIVNKWKSKGTVFYLKAVNDWTIRDVKKRLLARKNNLNWLEFFSYDEFINWFNTKISYDKDNINIL